MLDIYNPNDQLEDCWLQTVKYFKSWGFEGSFWNPIRTLSEPWFS